MIKLGMAVAVTGLVAALALPAAVAQSPDFRIQIGPRGLEFDFGRERGRDYFRCLDSRELRRVVSYQGWQDMHDWRTRHNSISLRGRQWGGLYQLEVDDCTGQLLEARRLDFDRGYWERRRRR